MALKVQNSGRTGWYYRVLEPGAVSPADALQRLEQINPRWTLARVLAVLYHDVLNAEELACLAQLPALTDRMSALESARRSRCAVEDWAQRPAGESAADRERDGEGASGGGRGGQEGS